MVNSSSNDGIPFHTNKEFLTGWLKEGLNWDGMIVTDWSDAKFAFSRDFTTPTYKEAIRRVIDAGVDMLMEPYSVEACDYLVELVNEKQLPMSRIDDAVRRILRLKFRLGLFDDPYGTSSDYAKFANPEFVKYAYNAALESEVLLKMTTRFSLFPRMPVFFW